MPETVSFSRDLIRGHKGKLATALVLAVLSTAATLCVPWAAKKLISALQTHDGLVSAALLMGGSAMGAAITQAFSSYLLERMGETLIWQLRGKVMNHALRMPLATVRAEGPGTLVARVTSDAILMRSIVDVGVVQLPIAATTVAATIGVMIYLDWLLAAVTIGVFVLAGIAIGFVLTRVRRNLIARQNQLGDLAQDFTATLGALTTIKASRAEKSTGKRLSGAAAVLRDNAFTGAKLQSLLAPTMGLGQQAALVSVIVIGGARISDGHLSVASFAAFLLYLMQLVAPVTFAVTGINQLQAGMAAKGRFNSLLAMAQEPSRTSDDPAVDDGTAVRFDAVHFSHTAGQPALSGASFSVPSAGLTAIVGPSGAGKTTALALIERFHTPESGTVSVLGRPTTAWELSELRNSLSYTDQAFTLLEGAVRDNLTLGHESPPTDAEILSALDEVGLAEAVRLLPDGLDTVIGRENDLSGGQRQRLALARMYLSNAPVVLLDEPTSQLDAVNEVRLRDAIAAIAKSKAVIVVAHRLSTVQDADHIVVMSSGDVTAAGTHIELMDTCSTYRELVESQERT
ncbi:ABC transporter ATP-binding protein [Streptomyces sp. ISL-11]|uniref:ABC transporter ATP-binding protein n=1 Tax=Streptomyces sp. ISL-11 TaxID=2819174 RepID=UPI001BE94E4B|nr:ABC transporter ATP-binding protein [Streptomyces sp. ISL-11]MBT2386688.1 ABC transporter ATP-binding protein [Streptomyces sp. ISL-11]